MSPTGVLKLRVQDRWNGKGLWYGQYLEHIAATIISYGTFDWFKPFKYSLLSSELSHSILAIAISQVSLTIRSESDKYSWRMGIEDDAEIAPIASAAYSNLGSWPQILFDKHTPHAGPLDLLMCLWASFQEQTVQTSFSSGLSNRPVHAWVKQMNRGNLRGDYWDQLVHEFSSPKPSEIIWTASSFFKAFSVNNARNLVCRGTFPDLLRREASKVSRSDGYTTVMSQKIIFGGLPNSSSCSTYLTNASIEALKARYTLWDHSLWKTDGLVQSLWRK